MNPNAALLSFLLALFTLHNETAQDSGRTRLTKKEFIQTALLCYADRLFTTLSHEIGHAVTAHLLHGDAIDIHLGNRENKALLSYKSCISVDGFNPAIGYSRFQNVGRSDKTVKKLKQLVILIAGSCAGIVGHWLAKTARLKIKNPDQSLWNLSKEATNFDLIYFDQLYNLLFPAIYSETTFSDGYRIMSLLEVPQETIDTIASYSPEIITISSYLYYAMLFYKKEKVVIFKKA